jgi:hypothetical protein
MGLPGLDELYWLLMQVSGLDSALNQIKKITSAKQPALALA